MPDANEIPLKNVLDSLNISYTPSQGKGIGHFYQRGFNDIDELRGKGPSVSQDYVIQRANQVRECLGDRVRTYFDSVEQEKFSARENQSEHCRVLADFYNQQNNSDASNDDVKTALNSIGMRVAKTGKNYYEKRDGKNISVTRAYAAEKIKNYLAARDSQPAEAQAEAFQEPAHYNFPLQVSLYRAGPQCDTPLEDVCEATPAIPQRRFGWMNRFVKGIGGHAAAASLALAVGLSSLAAAGMDAIKRNTDPVAAVSAETEAVINELNARTEPAAPTVTFNNPKPLPVRDLDSAIVLAAQAAPLSPAEYKNKKPEQEAQPAQSIAAALAKQTAPVAEQVKEIPKHYNGFTKDAPVQPVVAGSDARPTHYPGFIRQEQVPADGKPLHYSGFSSVGEIADKVSAVGTPSHYRGFRRDEPAAAVGNDSKSLHYRGFRRDEPAAAVGTPSHYAGFTKDASDTEDDKGNMAWQILAAIGNDLNQYRKNAAGITGDQYIDNMSVHRNAKENIADILARPDGSWVRFKNIFENKTPDGRQKYTVEYTLGNAGNGVATITNITVGPVTDLVAAGVNAITPNNKIIQAVVDSVIRTPLYLVRRNLGGCPGGKAALGEVAEADVLSKLAERVPYLKAPDANTSFDVNRDGDAGFLDKTLGSIPVVSRFRKQGAKGTNQEHIPYSQMTVELGGYLAILKAIDEIKEDHNHNNNRPDGGRSSGGRTGGVTRNGGTVLNTQEGGVSGIGGVVN